MFLTIDTSIYEHFDYNFEYGLLQKLEQFKDHPVRLVVSDVVHHEMRSHMAGRIKAARVKYEAGLKAARKEGLIGEKELKTVSGLTDVELAENRLRSFYERCGAEVLSSDEVTAKEMLDGYFNIKPPFHEKNKSEFPDAIALSAIRNHAIATKQRALVVSKDKKGWKAYCKLHPELMECEEQLAVALEKLQDENLFKKVMSELSFFDLIGVQALKVEKAITEALTTYVSELQVDVLADAAGNIYWEAEDVVSTYKSHDYHMNKGHIDAVLVNVETGGVVVAINTIVTYDVEATFSLEMEDPIDRDVFKLPAQTRVALDQKMQAEVLVTVNGNFAEGLDGVNVEKVEVDGSADSVEFGELSAWVHEEEDEGPSEGA